MVVASVRDEFQSMLADVERRATVQALRTQQQAAQVQGREHLYSASSTLAAAGSAARAQPLYRRDTLCRPRFEVPEKQQRQQQPAVQSAVAPVVSHSASSASSSSSSSSSDSVRTLPSEGTSTHIHVDGAESKEQKDGVASPPQQLPDGAAPLSSLQVEPPLSPASSAHSFVTAGASLDVPSHEPTGAWRPLETQILSVQAAIRQRLLVRHIGSTRLTLARGLGGAQIASLRSCNRVCVWLPPRDCLLLP